MFGQGSKVLCCWGSYSSLECWFFHHFWMHLASIYTFGSSLRLFALSFFWLGALLFWLLSICGLREVTPSCKNFDWIGWFVNFSNIGNCYRVRRNLWFFFFFWIKELFLIWIGFEDCLVELKLRWRLVRYCLRFLFSLDLGFSIWDSP